MAKNRAAVRLWATAAFVLPLAPSSNPGGIAMSAEVTRLPMKQDDRALTCDEVRHRLYQLAALAQCGGLAIDGMEDRNNDELHVLWRVFAEIESQLQSIAGGPSFDRLSELEGKRA